MAGEIDDLEDTLGYDPIAKKPRGRPRRKLVCKHGHPLVGDNIINRPNGKRNCRTCKNALNRKWKAKNPDYHRRYYARKLAKGDVGAVKLRFLWDGDKGKAVGPDVLRLMKTDWVIATDFLEDVIRLTKDCYDEVLKAKYTPKEQTNGG